MFDPTTLFPNMYHPVQTARNCALTGPAKHSTRTRHPPRYYLIDFGLSQRFDDISGTLTAGEKATHLPERDEAFALDVRSVGELVRTRLIDVSAPRRQPFPHINTRM